MDKAARVIEYACQPFENSSSEEKAIKFVSQSVSGTDGAMLEEWLKEINALPKKKRKTWKGHLYDQRKVRQQVRYIGEARTVMGVPYNVAVLKQQCHRGGGGWWPVLSADGLRGTDTHRLPVSANGHRMLESTDMHSTGRGNVEGMHC